MESETSTRLLQRRDLGLRTPWEAPRTETTVRLAALWQQVLGIDAVGTADDFFDLGGDSFAATTLASQIEETFGLRYAPSDIINHTTIAMQAQFILSKALGLATELPPHLILGRAGGTERPVFMVHGGHGFAFFKPDFFDEVGRDRPIYLFQAPGLDGRTDPLDSVEEFAALYVDTMRQVQPTGPYNIVAMCGGSFIGLEMCNQLNGVGEGVARLILLDPPVSPPSEKDKREAETREASRSSLIYSVISRIYEVVGSTKSSLPQRPTRAHKREAKIERIAKRLEQEQEVTGSTSQGEAAHTVETRVKVVALLKEALTKHVPRPYSGNAAMLIRSAKVGKMTSGSAFWPTHVGSLDVEVCETDEHKEVFGSHLTETARFVRRSLT
jgi:thioesterase domain-containing protein/acyl carrier protein